MQHRRATAASMFQNGISRNTKCDNMVDFPKSSHIYSPYLENILSMAIDVGCKDALCAGTSAVLIVPF